MNMFNGYNQPMYETDPARESALKKPNHVAPWPYNQNFYQNQENPQISSSPGWHSKPSYPGVSSKCACSQCLQGPWYHKNAESMPGNQEMHLGSTGSSGGNNGGGSNEYAVEGYPRTDAYLRGGALMPKVYPPCSYPEQTTQNYNPRAPAVKQHPNTDFALERNPEQYMRFFGASPYGHKLPEQRPKYWEGVNGPFYPSQQYQYPPSACRYPPYNSPYYYQGSSQPQPYQNQNQQQQPHNGTQPYYVPNQMRPMESRAQLPVHFAKQDNNANKISPLRLMRKKKLAEPACQLSPPRSTQPQSDGAPPLDVRRFLATWADEDEDSSPVPQMVVLDCQELNDEQAALLRLYEESTNRDVEDCSGDTPQSKLDNHLPNEDDKEAVDLVGELETKTLESETTVISNQPLDNSISILPTPPNDSLSELPTSEYRKNKFLDYDNQSFPARPTTPEESEPETLPSKKSRKRSRKPTIKFSIKKSHDLKISLQVMNDGDNEERDVAPDETEPRSEIDHDSRDSMTLQLADTSNELDLRTKRRKMKKKRIVEELYSVSSEDQYSDIATDGFQVEESVDSAKIKLTFKRRRGENEGKRPRDDDLKKSKKAKRFKGLADHAAKHDSFDVTSPLEAEEEEEEEEQAAADTTTDYNGHPPSGLEEDSVPERLQSPVLTEDPLRCDEPADHVEASGPNNEADASLPEKDADLITDNSNTSSPKITSSCHITSPRTSTDSIERELQAIWNGDDQDATKDAPKPAIEDQVSSNGNVVDFYTENIPTLDENKPEVDGGSNPDGEKPLDRESVQSSHNIQISGEEKKISENLAAEQVDIVANDLRLSVESNANDESKAIDFILEDDAFIEPSILNKTDEILTTENGLDNDSSKMETDEIINDCLTREEISDDIIPKLETEESGNILSNGECEPKDLISEVAEDIPAESLLPQNEVTEPMLLEPNTWDAEPKDIEESQTPKETHSPNHDPSLPTSFIHERKGPRTPAGEPPTPNHYASSYFSSPQSNSSLSPKMFEPLPFRGPRTPDEPFYSNSPLTPCTSPLQEGLKIGPRTPEELTTLKDSTETENQIETVLDYEIKEEELAFILVRVECLSPIKTPPRKEVDVIEEVTNVELIEESVELQSDENANIIVSENTLNIEFEEQVVVAVPEVVDKSNLMLENDDELEEGEIVDEYIVVEISDDDVEDEPVILDVRDIPLPPGEAPKENCFDLEKLREMKKTAVPAAQDCESPFPTEVLELFRNPSPPGTPRIQSPTPVANETCVDLKELCCDVDADVLPDDAEFQDVMASCLANAEKFLDRDDVEVAVDAALETVDKTMSSRDVLLASFEAASDLDIGGCVSSGDVSMDFSPCYTALGTESLPVDNWPYLEEEVPLSPEWLAKEDDVPLHEETVGKAEDKIDLFHPLVPKNLSAFPFCDKPKSVKHSKIRRRTVEAVHQRLIARGKFSSERQCTDSDVDLDIIKENLLECKKKKKYTSAEWQPKVLLSRVAKSNKNSESRKTPESDCGKLIRPTKPINLKTSLVKGCEIPKITNKLVSVHRSLKTESHSDDKKKEKHSIDRNRRIEGHFKRIGEKIKTDSERIRKSSEGLVGAQKIQSRANPKERDVSGMKKIEVLSPMKQRDPKPRSASNRKKEINEEPWSCDVCGFSNASDREQHIQTHAFSCYYCHLAFKCETVFIEHLEQNHKDMRQLHHCILCEVSFESDRDYGLHMQSREHTHLEAVERNTIRTLFTLLSGDSCPDMGEPRPKWLPNDEGAVHFYHKPTPLTIAIQYWQEKQKSNLPIPR